MHLAASGILGLAFNEISRSQATPFWEVLARSGKLPSPLFTMQLGRQAGNSKARNPVVVNDLLNPGGVLTLGFIDTDQYSGPVT